MTDAQLLAAINANATALAQAGVGNDAGCAATISAALPPVVAPIAVAELNVWGCSRGILHAIAAGAAGTNAAIASACIGVQSALNGGAQVLDLTNANVVALLAGLTAAGILATNTDTTGASPTPGSSADLLAYASVPQVINPGDVSRVMLPSRPNGQIGGG
jgi:hypothetical protein